MGLKKNILGNSLFNTQRQTFFWSTVNKKIKKNSLKLNRVLIFVKKKRLFYYERTLLVSNNRNKSYFKLSKNIYGFTLPILG